MRPTDDQIAAHRCANCVAPAGQRCPHWISADDGIIETNDRGEQRVFVGCSCGAFQARMARFIIGTLDHYTTEISKGRAESTANLAALAKQLEASRKSIVHAISEATRTASREAILEQFADALIEHRARVRGPNGA